ncbi:LssY C-terminal domain-containing protein [Trinickia dabaoshanensis]|nr:LssY C-terminal domain-containing protein [Trinickia dabaoshanensis]
MHTWLVSISNHPYLVLAVVFAIAVAEAIAVVGTIAMVPASIVMFFAGALVGAGALDVWPTLALSALGGIVGDGLSYELGRHFHGKVRSWFQAKGQEVRWVRGEQFVERHGGKSLLLARFFAPVRSTVPLLVGTAHMGRLKFYAANVASALVWAPINLIPGIVFGASAALAEAVSTRLAAALILLVVLLYLVVRLARLTTTHGIPAAKRTARYAMLEMARRLPQFGGRIQRVIKLDDPEFPTISAFSLLLIASVWLFGGVLQDVIANDPLMRTDTALYTFLQSLHATPADAVMAGIAALNGRIVGFAMASAVLIWFVLRRSWKTAAWWIILVGIAVVQSPFDWAKSGGALPLDWRPGAPHIPLPDGLAAFNILVYGFLGWVITRRQATSWRGAVAIAIALWIVIGGLADLYFGKTWLSGLLGGWALGLAWFAILGGAYALWHVQDDMHPKSVALVVIGSLAVAGSWAIPAGLQSIVATSVPVSPAITIFKISEWTAAGWQQIPARRMDFGGEEEEPLLLQWPASSRLIEQRLQRSGWQAAPAWSVRSALGWLLPRSRPDELPVLPKYAQGENSQLTFMRPDPDLPESRFVLRLWSSHYAIQGTQGAEPLWYGAVYHETLSWPAHLFTRVSTQNITSAATIVKLLDLQDRPTIRSMRAANRTRDVVLVLPVVSGASNTDMPPHERP